MKLLLFVKMKLKQLLNVQYRIRKKSNRVKKDRFLQIKI